MSGSVLSGELEKLEAKPRVFKPDIVRHYHIDHNAPCPPPPPPKKKKKKKRKNCITIVSNFSWVLQSSQEKLKTMVVQKFWGVNNVHYGLCEK